jgi:hypothetical protein
MPRKPRIVLIHALRDSQVPSWAAFASGWPEAEIFNLLDDSLSADLAAAGDLGPAMIDRFLTLGRYAAASGAKGQQTEAILFTCSAFGPAIEAVKADLSIPVLAPNEAAFEQALQCGRRVGIIVTFPPSLPALSSELQAMAQRRGVALELTGAIAEGALAALQSGRGEEHDKRIAAVAAQMPALDALILGQFSAARALSAIAPVRGRQVFTTPQSAVTKLKQLVG